MVNSGFKPGLQVKFPLLIPDNPHFEFIDYNATKPVQIEHVSTNYTMSPM